MSLPSDREIEIVSPDSDFVHAILKADTLRKMKAQALQKPANSADICESDPEQIASIVNAAFWASQAVEEGRPIRGILCVVSADEVPSGFSLSHPLPVSRQSIVSLMTAAPDSALAIHTGSSGNPEIWGIIDGIPFEFLKFRIADIGTVVASINNNAVAIIHNGCISIPPRSDVFSWVSIVSLAFGSGSSTPDRIQKATILLKIVASMFRHAHGGTLVVAPVENTDWHDSLNIKYQFVGTDGSNVLKQRLMDLMELRDASQSDKPSNTPGIFQFSKMQVTEASVRLVNETLRIIGNLTALDGAVVISSDFTLFGFGAKIQIGQDNFDIGEIDLLDGNLNPNVHLSDIGGTRHQSAARLVKKHNDVLAFVASQDGRLTLFVWSEHEKKVTGLKNLHHMIWDYKL